MAVNWKREGDRLSLQGCCCCSQTDRMRSTGREKVTGHLQGCCYYSQTARRQSTGREKVTCRANKAAAAVHRQPEGSQLEERRWQAAYKAAATVHRQPEGSQLEERRWHAGLTRLLLLFTDSQKAVNWKREGDMPGLQGCCYCSQTARRQSTGREKVTCRANKAAAAVHRQPEGGQLEERKWQVELTRLLLLFTDRQKAVNWKREGDMPGLQGCCCYTLCCNEGHTFKYIQQKLYWRYKK